MLRKIPFSSSRRHLAFFIIISILSATMSSAAKATTTLVVGASGATGRHVVAQLLQKNQNVRAIARSKERFFTSLDEIIPKASSTYAEKLQVTEAAILDLSDEQLQEQVDGCDAVVQCLGHNISFKGMYGAPRKLVTDAAKRLTSSQLKALQANDKSNKPVKFILMGSDGVANPDGPDDKRPFKERLILGIIRALVPPHRDNEGAALYLSKDVAQTNSDKLEWSVVRPTDLIDGEASKYVLYDKPVGGLFGASVTTRANVAQFMVDLVLTEDLWAEHKFKMPVVHDADQETK